MNRLAYIVFSGILLLAGARSLTRSRSIRRAAGSPSSGHDGRAQTRRRPRRCRPIRPQPRPHPSLRSQSIWMSAATSFSRRGSRSSGRADGPVFDPLHAQRSLDVGKFYLNKGSYDAAIDRFIEASNYQPSLAAPWRFLGDAYEKKHEYAKAIECVQ